MLVVEGVTTLHILADYAFGHFLTEKVELRMKLNDTENETGIR